MVSTENSTVMYKNAVDAQMTWFFNWPVYQVHFLYDVPRANDLYYWLTDITVKYNI